MSPKVKFTFIWWITSDLFHSTSRILPRTICSPHFHQDTRSYSKRFILFQQPFNPRFLLASWNNSVMLCTLFNQCLLQQWQDACIDHTGPETLFSFTSRVPADLLKKRASASLWTLWISLTHLCICLNRYMSTLFIKIINTSFMSWLVWEKSW